MAKKPDHGSRAHALLSASSSSRWLACPPSAAAAELYQDTDTEYTREGTLAHEIAEIMAKGTNEHILNFKWIIRQPLFKTIQTIFG